MKFLIECLSPLSLWSFLEYKHLSSFVGNKNVLFTHVTGEDMKKLSLLGRVEKKSVKDLGLRRVCLLDFHAPLLKSSDAKNFDFFVFGGILGDYPRKKRTKRLLRGQFHCAVRSLGEVQMSTDTAVIVAMLILKGKRFEDLSFIDKPCFILQKGIFEESLVLPYRYLSKNGKAVLAPGLLNYLKKKEDL